MPRPAEPSGEVAVAGELPAVPRVQGPLALRVVYPAPGAMVQARDSSFLFGSAGSGDAALTVNGHPVEVWPNGAWLAWVALPPDSLMEFHLVARTPTDSTRLTHVVRRSGWRPAPPAGLWIDTTTLAPRGSVWWPREEYLGLRVRASEGAEVRLRLPDGSLLPLGPVRESEEVPGSVHYASVIRGRALGPDPGPLLRHPVTIPVAAAARCASTRSCGSPPAESGAPDSSWAVVEAIRGADTVRSRWPLQLALLDTLPVVAELDDDTTGAGETDGITPGRALPGGTYHWFFPRGTRALVSGRANGNLRLRLSPTSEAWVAAAEARPLAPARPAPAVAGSVILTPRDDRVTVRIPLSRRVPFRVIEGERSLELRLYGAVGDIEWIRYGATDSLVDRVRWAQEAADEVTLRFALRRPVWGYRAQWDAEDLLLDIRRPPRLHRRRPLRGRLIAVDPGHPPAGATGPTGLREAEANLGVALELRRMLEDAGAKVLMTRTADVPMELWRRVELAEAADADLLVSVHNNALPDGINPFTSSGTSVYYNQLRSVPLARAIQEELVRHLGLRDLGFGRGDLALVRATWMPSVLTEGLFMILPEQEAALRTVEGRRLYAAAVLQGIRRFLGDRAREP